MSDKDPLASFDFDDVIPAGLYLKWEAGVPYKLRVLTVDPVVFTNTFKDPKTGEEGEPSTKFAFIVYNFTKDKAQILQSTPAMARKISEIHKDPDFGSDIKKIDLKVTPTGEKLERRYDIQVLPTSEMMTNEQVLAARKIDLDAEISKNNGFTQRMSLFNPTSIAQKSPDFVPDIVVEPSDEPINLEDIPF